MQIKVSDYIAKQLVKHGIEHVFTVTGGGAMHLNDALGHCKGLHCIYNHHEQACAIAAESYARIHNKIAVTCVTTGPGGTNAITGVVGGWLDSIPMLIISGQVRYDTTARSTGLAIRAMGDQEFDITKAVDSMTKYCEMVIEPKRIRFCLEKALYLAKAGRPGPCWLDIPVNVQGAFVEEEELQGFDVEDYLQGGTGWNGEETYKIPEDEKGKGEFRPVMPSGVQRKTVEEVIAKIKAAERPVFNAGNGIRIADAHKEFMKVVELLNIPVVVGWNSQDCLYNAHPLYVGRGGGMGDRPGNFAVQNSDLVFSVGSRLSIRQVGYDFASWAREAYVIVNDVDAEELKKPSVHSDMRIHADAKELLAVMGEVLEEMKQKGELHNGVLFQGGKGLPGQTWLETCSMWKEKYPVVLPKHWEHGEEEPANVYAFIGELGKHTKEGQVIVVGNGSACVVGGHGLEIKPGQRFISNSAIASMGYDLPAAIGACVAEGWKEMVLITGDGSIQMNIQELQTIIHHQMPIKLFLINNQGYHSIRQTQKNYFGEPLVGIGADSGLEGPDLSFPAMEKLAAAYGYSYLSARHNQELETAIEKAMAAKGPIICEIFVSTDQNFEPKSAAKRLPDGTMVSPPLEDLAPFLPEEEMEQNMIIARIKG